MVGVASGSSAEVGGSGSVVDVDADGSIFGTFFRLIGTSFCRLFTFS